MDKLILYNYFRSSTSYRVRIVLHWKELPFDYKPIHLVNFGGEQYTEGYRTLNPASEVPTLVHEGRALAQSMAIVEYLDEVFPEKKLLPSNPFLKAQVRQFCENINCTHPLQNLKVLKYLDGTLTIQENQKEAWLKHWISKGLQVAESLTLKHGGKYCFGDTLTLADAFLVPQIFSAVRFKVDIAPFRKLVAINESCMEIEAFKRAHPFRQPDTPEEFKAQPI